MNAFEAAKKLYNISDEIEVLNNAMQKVSRIDDKKRLEKQIDSLESEFFSMKHQMERIKISFK